MNNFEPLRNSVEVSDSHHSLLAAFDIVRKNEFPKLDEREMAIAQAMFALGVGVMLARSEYDGKESQENPHHIGCMFEAIVRNLNEFNGMIESAREVLKMQVDES